MSTSTVSVLWVNLPTVHESKVHEFTGSFSCGYNLTKAWNLFSFLFLSFRRLKIIVRIRPNFSEVKLSCIDVESTVLSFKAGWYEFVILIKGQK